MIDKALNFILVQLEDYLQVQQSNHELVLPNPTKNVVLGNVSQVGTNDGDDLNNNIVISLINVEEDRVSRPVNNYVRINQQVVYKNPPVYINLFVLFTACYSNYTSSLLLLSMVIKFFQYKNVFTTLDAPDLPQEIGELIFDLKTLTIQDLNNLWGILGSKYLPSVMYKVRLVKISQEFEQGDVSLINEIIVNSKNLQSS